jgi:hypothetical protein
MSTTSTVPAARIASSRPVSRARTRRFVTVVAASLVLMIGLGATPASAVPARWIYVGKESFSIEGEATVVPVYVNRNSIDGDRNEGFTITFQARYKGRKGVNRVNMGVVVDCVDYNAYADQFIVYYGAGSSDFDTYTDGYLSPQVTNKALSYCY